MFCTDLLINISGYLENNNLKYICFDLYKNILIYESSKEWQTKYNNCVNTKNLISLNGNYNWKYEYARINGYDKWKLFDQVSGWIIHLPNNQIKEVPKEIGRLINLQSLNLYNNQIKKVPKEIGQLINLQSLCLDNNQIKQVPKELGVLIHLQRLYLYNNQIKKLPKEIGQLINLHTLFLFNNQIKKLPKELGQLINLQELNLSGNQIKKVSKEIQQLTAKIYW